MIAGILDQSASVASDELDSETEDSYVAMVEY